MKKGNDIKIHLLTSSRLERAEWLVNELDPYLNKYMNPVDNANLTRREVFNIIISRAIELFDCENYEIEECYSEYGYFVPIDLFREYFIEKTFIGNNRFIPEIDRVIQEKNARLLWEVEKREIDKAMEEYLKLRLPVSHCIDELKNKYRIWSNIPDSKEDKLLYFCWRNHIGPYLKKVKQRTNKGKK